jgi:diguanylate cyclase (GGDEF)-like protein
VSTPGAADGSPRTGVPAGPRGETSDGARPGPLEFFTPADEADPHQVIDLRDGAQRSNGDHPPVRHATPAAVAPVAPTWGAAVARPQGVRPQGVRPPRPPEPLTPRVLGPAAAAVVLTWGGAALAAMVGAQVGAWASVAVATPVIAGSAVLLAQVRRRLRREVDEPLAIVHTAARSWLAGDLTARAALEGRTVVTALADQLDDTAANLDHRLRRLTQQAEWGDRSRMIFEALDLAENETEAHGVVERALSAIDPEQPVELLLSPPGSRELFRVATNTSVPSPGCQAEHTGGCVAIRRGQTVVFDSSDAINACPKLQGRPGGPLSAACIPVAVGGRPVGVLHATGADLHPPGEPSNGQLATLASQVGNRLGSLRALASSRREASTDGLTGLPNRRMLEGELATLVERGTEFVLVMADLDSFKRLNDDYGHETGDRALQVVAGVLRDNVRGDDVVARLGGEEFVLVYPNMSLTTSIEAIERIRDALASALPAARLPEFTCSFGITHSSAGQGVTGILRIADAGLLRAKELGGDQVVYADQSLAAEIFGEDNNGGRRS